MTFNRMKAALPSWCRLLVLTLGPHPGRLSGHGWPAAAPDLPKVGTMRQLAKGTEDCLAPTAATVPSEPGAQLRSCPTAWRGP